jgi:hypothetical protein
MMLSRKLVVATCAAAIGASAAAALLFFSYVRDARLARTQGAGQGRGGSPVVQANPSQPKVAEVGLEATQDWPKEYDKSSDYFDFVSKAAEAAYNGDSKAALFISKALYICTPIQREFAKSRNPQSDFDDRWAARSHAPQWVLDKARKDFQACAGFIKGDAFAALPPRSEGYNSIRYWLDKSANDPVAQALQAGSAIANTKYEKSSDANTKSLDSAQKSVNSAMESRDPAALFQVGRLLSDGNASSDPLQGFALSIVACNMGYDCSANNSEIFNGCAAQGQCPPGTTYADTIKKLVGEEGYAQAYARAQQIQDALARDDMDALHQFVQLKR